MTSKPYPITYPRIRFQRYADFLDAQRLLAENIWLCYFNGYQYCIEVRP